MLWREKTGLLWRRKGLRWSLLPRAVSSDRYRKLVVGRSLYRWPCPILLFGQSHLELLTHTAFEDLQGEGSVAFLGSQCLCSVSHLCSSWCPWLGKKKPKQAKTTWFSHLHVFPSDIFVHEWVCPHPGPLLHQDELPQLHVSLVLEPRVDTVLQVWPYQHWVEPLL